jgi:hypothetical protein
VNSQLFSERIDLRDLCTAMTPPQTLDNRQYKCNRVANSKALNSPHLLQKQVPKILKCRNVRGNESEREEGLACGADQNEPTRTRKLMGFDSSLNERCAARIFKNDRAIIPATFSGSIGRS